MVERKRRFTVAIITALLIIGGALYTQLQEQQTDEVIKDSSIGKTLETLPIKGRAPKTNYSRDQFGGDWSTTLGCDTRNRILQRDLKDISYDEDNCKINSGILHDPYTNKQITFARGESTSSAVQIDHVVALSDAWQKGAQQLTYEERVELANDGLNLLAVDGPANMQKSDGDAATWLPPHKAFRCQYVSRQVSVKKKYELWVTQAEHDAMKNIIADCPKTKLSS